MDLKAFVKFVGGLLGALGGSAALFVAFGYITLQSFLSHMRLYGLADFPLRFYKEASVNLLRDLAIFYLNHPASALIPLGILVAVLLVKGKLEKRAEKPSEQEKPKQQKKQSIPWSRIAGITGLIMISAVIILPFAAANRGRLDLEGIIFNVISLPILIILFFFLAVDFSKLDPVKPLKNFYFWYVMSFIILLMSIPVIYGFYLFDIPVFTASVPYCNTEKTHFGVPQGQGIDQKTDIDNLQTGGYKLLYLMGHTAEREIFFDATKLPTTIILVDKKLINSIKINFSKIQIQTLRILLDAQTGGLLDQSPDELRKVIKGKLGTFEKDQLDRWMAKEESSQAKEKKDVHK
jgi:hypothetical protein